MRGKEAHELAQYATEGITPACAGKRCGECRQVIQPDGSPPRVRGKVLAALMPENRVGITPACAGKSLILVKRWCFLWDHPRVCGEKA